MNRSRLAQLGGRLWQGDISGPGNAKATRVQAAWLKAIQPEAHKLAIRMVGAKARRILSPEHPGAGCGQKPDISLLRDGCEDALLRRRTDRQGKVVVWPRLVAFCSGGFSEFLSGIQRDGDKNVAVSG